MNTATTAAMFAMVALLGLAGLTQGFAQLQTTNSSSQLNAETISQTNSVTTDSDIKNLVILIPDNAGNGSSQQFLPGNATIATGTNVIWVNADVNRTHSLTVKAEDGSDVLNASIPYQNGTDHTFESEGQYTFSDPASGISGTINVVEDAPDDPLTNSSMPTLGLLAVPSRGEVSFNAHLSKLGFNAVSSAIIGQDQGGSPIAGGTGNNNSTILYVWIQQADDSDTVINRLASKLRTLEGLLYPGGAVKQT